MTNDKGITIIALVITVILIIILAGVGIDYGTDSYDIVQFQNFKYELQQVQGKVDVIYEKIKLGNDEEKASYITLGYNITGLQAAVNVLNELTGIDYSDMSEEDAEEYYYNEVYTTYRYLTEDKIKEELNITSNPGDMIINFQTREVISIKGFEFEGKTYYRLSDYNE